MARSIGFIGLGAIGKPMALHLPSRFDTVVYDVAPEPVAELVTAGARAASSPAELARDCEIVGVCVPADAQVRAVVCGESGILATASPGTIVALHSTIMPATATEMAALAAEKDVVVVDAPMTGGTHGAADGSLTYMVGGDAAHVEAIRPYLEASAKTIIHAGGLGNGSKLKLCLNLMGYVHFAVANEAVSLAQATGLPLDVLEEAGVSGGQLSPNVVQYMALGKLPAKVVAGDDLQTMLRGRLGIADKDLDCALALARQAGVTLPVGGLVAQQMARVFHIVDDRKR